MIRKKKTDISNLAISDSGEVIPRTSFLQIGMYESFESYSKRVDDWWDEREKEVIQRKV